MVRLRDGGLVWLQDDLGPVVVDMESSQDQDQSGEAGVAGYCPQPVVVHTG